MFVKPLFKTLFLSSVIFGLTVILGMKYQWVDYLKSADKKSVELALPQHSLPRLAPQERITDREDFQLEIIRSHRQPITANMTKEAITLGCQQLYNKMGLQKNEFIDIAIGDCVVSNYQESIQDVTTQNILDKNKQKASKVAFNKGVVEKACYQKTNVQTSLNALEKQLFFGVCVSDGIN